MYDRFLNLPVGVSVGVGAGSATGMLSDASGDSCWAIWIDNDMCQIAGDEETDDVGTKRSGCWINLARTGGYVMGPTSVSASRPRSSYHHSRDKDIKTILFPSYSARPSRPLSKTSR